MKKISWEYWFLFLISGILAIILLFTLTKAKDTDTSSLITSNQITDSVVVSPSAGAAGGVSVSVAYAGGDEDGWNFNLNFDTHNVNLDAYDYQKGIYLEKNEGLYPSLKIEVSGQTHHKKAEAVFEKIELPFAIIIKNLSAIPRREFKVEGERG